MIYKLRQIRNERNPNQQYIANKIRIDRSYYTKIESKSRVLSLKVALK